MSHGLYLALAGVFVLMFVLERLFPARRVSFDRPWFLRAIVVNLVQLGIMVAIALAASRLLAGRSWFEVGGHWPAPLAGLAAAMLGSLVQYGWHRAVHASDLLWRIFHQMHHSPTHIDVLATNYSHPLDYVVNTTIHTVAAVAVLGLDPDGIAWSVFIYGVNNYYAHCNLRSPYWLGYLLQRPEMHRIHHKRGHHAQNYGFPVWDMLFGTWVNPVDADDYDCGFGEGREARVWAMLAGRDVNADEPASGKDEEGRQDLASDGAENHA
ncbi:hypothetical protein GCM10011521_20280 [Arenimonas soli]|uniref:Fatty acid hydroxylase domain-containing protein n=1 Tax=Arenimonas soli TaxID=2269504 RepID=A0ABQ1HMA8_9GAMM|nr:sterol desaturase family protein [Arenimonas soli]GGA81875.1 hypothetical protein GCM10011521_20280 [Arenimonas soli]